MSRFSVGDTVTYFGLLGSINIAHLFINNNTVKVATYLDEDEIQYFIQHYWSN